MAWIGGAARNNTAAFTLVELLLTVALLLLLLGAVTFSFSSLRRGSDLDEGASRVATLFRFARAHAAYTGGRVMVEFQTTSTQEVSSVTTAFARIFWEPETTAAPGTWKQLRGPEWNLEGLAELVTVTEFRSFEDTPRLLTAEADAESAAEAPPVSRIVFFPDGSSDSAEIILASRDPADTRQLAVRLTGLTGTIAQREVSLDPLVAEAPAGNDSAFPDKAIEAVP